MRLYLSSYGLGNQSQEILSLVHRNAKVAVIANALDFQPIEKREARVAKEMNGLRSLGLNPEELDLRNYFKNPSFLAEKMKNFDFVWVRGGNAFILRKAYQQSGFDAIIIELIKKDAVAYGGYSAGVCLLSPSLNGIELVDPVNQAADHYQQKTIWDGLNILSYSIAPHYKSEHPESEDIDKYVDYLIEHEMPYRTLHDGEAIIINGDNERFLAMEEARS